LHVNEDPRKVPFPTAWNALGFYAGELLREAWTKAGSFKTAEVLQAGVRIDTDVFSFNGTQAPSQPLYIAQIIGGVPTMVFSPNASDITRDLKYPKDDPIFEQTRDNSVQVILTAAAVLSFVLLMIVVLWMFMLRKEVTWTRSFIIYTVLFLTGGILITIGVCVAVPAPESWSCSLSLSLASMGITLLLAAVLAKQSAALYQAMTGDTEEHLRCQFSGIAVICGLQLILLVVGLAVSPIKQAISTAGLDEFEYELCCKTDSAVVLILNLTLLGTLLLGSGVLTGVLFRKTDDFSEAKRLGVAVLNVLIMIGASIILYFFFVKRAQVKEMVLALACSLSGSLIIGIKFLPELWALQGERLGGPEFEEEVIRSPPTPASSSPEPSGTPMDDLNGLEMPWIEE
jgi:hypothetical protein